MVDKVLFKPWIDVEIEHVTKMVSKTGWSPLPEGYRYIQRTFEKGNPIAVDKTAWDWTMPGWVAECYFNNKILQCQNPSWKYVRACRSRFEEVLRSATFRLSDGSRYRQKEAGIMKSGWLLTLSANSAAQFYQHVLAWAWAVDFVGKHRILHEIGIPKLWAMGDDMLVDFATINGSLLKVNDEFLELYEQALRETGCLVKHLKRGIEFAGYSFDEGKVEPLYQEKHQFILNYVNPDVEQMTLLSYHLLYSKVSGFGWLGKVRERAEFPVGVQFQRWADGMASLRCLTGDLEWMK